MAMLMPVFTQKITHSTFVNVNITPAEQNVLNAALDLCRKSGDQEMAMVFMSVNVSVVLQSCKWPSE